MSFYAPAQSVALRQTSLNSQSLVLTVEYSQSTSHHFTLSAYTKLGTQMMIGIYIKRVKTENVLLIVDNLSTGRRFTQKMTTTKITTTTKEIN